MQLAMLENFGPTTSWSQVTRRKGDPNEGPIGGHDESQRPTQAGKGERKVTPSPRKSTDDVDVEYLEERGEKGWTWDRTSPIRGAVRPRHGLCECSLNHLSSAAIERRSSTAYAGLCWSSIDLCYCRVFGCCSLFGVSMLSSLVYA